MLGFAQPSVYEKSKCFFSYGRLPHIDPHQLPTAWEDRGKPWSSVLLDGLVSKVDLVMPQDQWQAVQERLVGNVPAPEFCRVTMTLLQILRGDFFTEYIKIGDIVMLSRGRNGLDNVFTLKDGQLTMCLDKETYERAGLVGKPHGAKGNRGLRPRWVVEFDLRSPSMLHGRPGFDRLVYACKNTLTEPLTWLFCNVSNKTPDPDPLEAFQPTKFRSSPQTADHLDVAVPPLTRPPGIDTATRDGELPQFASEVYEWLSLVRLQSPRVSSADSVDPYLSRYHPPGESEQWPCARLCTVVWEGLLPPCFARKLLVEVTLTLPSQSWFSLAVSAFPKGINGDIAESTFLRLPGSPSEYLLWDVRSHE
ncbi:hypothetical protein N8I77_001683 [Diaporthe amygdali]|uniref:Uncharacterized protein n=1 Tax=Phomopsis amygdali TaxID=1214568 RepID=A0AAD9SS16_PHOAM|nr:hypothetical protein N8I77_001683 [Diaporthe amygdali]